MLVLPLKGIIKFVPSAELTNEDTPFMPSWNVCWSNSLSKKARCQMMKGNIPWEYIFSPAVSYPIIPTWRSDWMYSTHKIAFWINIYSIRLHRTISIAGSFYQLGGGGVGGVGSEKQRKDSTREVVGGFVGCLRQIYVDKLPATVKRLSGFTLNTEQHLQHIKAHEKVTNLCIRVSVCL